MPTTLLTSRKTAHIALACLVLSIVHTICVAGEKEAWAVIGTSISRDGRQLLIHSDYGHSKLWDISKEKEIRVFEGTCISNSSISADEKIVVTSKNNVAISWNASTGEKIREFEGHSDSITSLFLSLDGSVLVTGSRDSTARIWNVKTGKLNHVLNLDSCTVTSVSMSSDKEYVVTSSSDMSIKLWKVSSGELVRSFSENSTVWNTCISSGGKIIGSAMQDNTAALWDAQTGKRLFVLRGHQEWVTGISISPEEKYVATSSADKSLIIWDIATGNKVNTFKVHSSGVMTVNFVSPELLISGSDSDVTILLNPISGKVLNRIDINKKITQIVP